MKRRQFPEFTAEESIYKSANRYLDKPAYEHSIINNSVMGAFRMRRMSQPKAMSIGGSEELSCYPEGSISCLWLEWKCDRLGGGMTCDSDGGCTCHY